MRLTSLALILPAITLTNIRAPQQQTPKYTKVLALKPRESVFAYARISPDGKQLVYASRIEAKRPTGATGYTETLVDLTTGNVLFSAQGIDAYWSLDGKRLIYSGATGVTIRHNDTGEEKPDVVPNGLGDYYSWAVRDNRNLILTIDSKDYYLDGDKGIMPVGSVSACPGIGTGERPLISKDGRRITTFVQGNVVVRGLDNCDNIFDTGIQGAKADFSWDGRYIAFHAMKRDGSGYEIRIVDTQQRTVRTLTGLNGSALFPSWTQDGRLCFRYDGPDYRGFMMASDVLATPAEALPHAPEPLPANRTWHDIFPTVPAQEKGVSVVLIWAPWSAHSQIAFDELERARKYFATRSPGMTFAAAADPSSAESDIRTQLTDFKVTVPRIPLTGEGLLMTEARNQMPTTLLFRDGVLIDRKLGAQTFEQLRDWVGTATR